MAFKNLIDHLWYMITYHLSLRYSSTDIIPLYKWVLLMQYNPIPYYVKLVNSRLAINILGVAIPLCSLYLPMTLLSLFIGIKYKDDVMIILTITNIHVILNLP